jgi:hypothetical protein
MEALRVSPFPTIDSFYGMKVESSSAATASSTPAASIETPDKNVIAVESSSQIERTLVARSAKGRLLLKPPASRSRRAPAVEATDNKDRSPFLDRRRFLEKQISDKFCIMQLLDPNTFHDRHRTLQRQPVTGEEEHKKKSADDFPSIFQRGEGEGGEVTIDEVNQVLAAMSNMIDDDVSIGSEAALDSSKQEKKKTKKHKKHKKDDKKKKKDAKSRVPTSDWSFDDLAFPVLTARKEVRRQAETSEYYDRPSLPKLASRVPTSDRSFDAPLALPVLATRKEVRRQAETYAHNRPSLPKLASQVPTSDRSLDDPLNLPVLAPSKRRSSKASRDICGRPS